MQFTLAEPVSNICLIGNSYCKKFRKKLNHLVECIKASLDACFVETHVFKEPQQQSARSIDGQRRSCTVEMGLRKCCLSCMASTLWSVDDDWSTSSESYDNNRAGDFSDNDDVDREPTQLSTDHSSVFVGRFYENPAFTPDGEPGPNRRAFINRKYGTFNRFLLEHGSNSEKI